MAEQLWAPWRFDYVKKADETNRDGCIFVDLPAQDNDEENLILFRGKTAFIILNRYPYTSGHLMVAPYKHTADISDLSDIELLEIHQLVRDSMKWIKAVYHPNGFNVGLNVGAAGGAGIPSHLHWHIVPRWEGDTNFMTSIGNTRVIPEDLAISYRRLKEASRV
ncbi:MAG: HIT domain-containing protein [Armatimonadetes bacterium]|nr:HIT domain-containing protein [Armatimonadota bacterium]